MATRNVTIALDEETARWVRVEAARRDMSVSRFIGEFLRDRQKQADEYDAAMEAYFQLPLMPARSKPGPYPSRDEVHDRAGLRRQ